MNKNASERFDALLKAMTEGELRRVMDQMSHRHEALLDLIKGEIFRCPHDYVSLGECAERIIKMVREHDTKL